MFLIRKLTHYFVLLASRFLPDPFVLVSMLTCFVFVVGIFLTNQSPIQMLNHWGNGIWGLLAFSMQMALTLVLGRAVASAPVISRILNTLASMPKTPSGAIILVTMVGMIASYINWAFGLVVGAIFAREIAKNVKGVDYRLLIASAYSSFIIFQGGLSSSVALILAQGGETLYKTTGGILSDPIPVSETIFATYNIIIIVIIFILLPIVLASIHPSKEDTIQIDSALLEDKQDIEVISHKDDHTIAQKLENSRLLCFFTGAFGIVYLVMYFYNGGTLGLNIVIMIFLFVGILLHKTLIDYVKVISNSTKSSAGIILQFPFYAGIMGMMVGKSPDGDSLASVISIIFSNISTQETFPLFSFLSAGIVNIFVPSGGGQWSVQGPVMIATAQSLGTNPSVVAMAIAWGDAWTNMIQPFWALPALAIAGLGAKDIMGYCLITLILSGIVISFVFYFLV
ncbi:short-chain fatty acid transporter [Helicobacter muridarum]|uniref:Short-chain fatty acid transport protein, scFAT family membrane protein n=1 Tax=Helicobacter muridarum TaxID=216 RepID=A0A099TYF2_9HELI|nr:TIGR00366 family protein [Helicobacter muridarum]TLE00578.1 short-chain fatty acid transporter [Helicobacter muridarum]STQ85590.1 Short-chain fatty acid transport protein, scFAT family; membrane protein [Helicobacter muridarum]